MTETSSHRQRRRLRVKAWVRRKGFKTLVALGQIAAFFVHLFED